MSEFEQSMTLRDYFAAHAISAVVADSVKRNYPFSSQDAETLARTVYSIADAMLKVRKENGGNHDEHQVST